MALPISLAPGGVDRAGGPMSGLAYNPGLQGPEDLVQRFVARTQLLGRVVDDLRGSQPQHQLFIGQRGMGKTTLLRRVAIEVARHPALAARWIALTFPEEQYNVARLSDLWLNCLDALADALEQEGDVAQVEALDDFVQKLPADEAIRAPLALERLLLWTRAHRGMVLCIDNLQQLLGRLDKDERWALRKVLGEEQRLVVFAASPAPPTETTEYGEPFYDFFQAHALRGLTLDETREVLRNLATQAGKPDLAATFAEKSGRLRALHVLTGGNPRTVVQLFQVVSTSPGAEIRGQLEGLLDQCTPLYKARFEELAEQAQLVMDALAHHWDPATAAMVAERTRMDVNAVSTQLHRLHNEGLVDKVDLPGEARQGFQVSERFFNLWYLMRASRRHRGRVLSLARCLETLYDIDDLQALGAQLLAAPREADFSLALARALPTGGMQRALWSSAIDQVGGDERGFRELLVQLGAGGEPVRELAERKKVARAAMEVAKGIDFEGMGVERELGEVLVAFAAMEGVPLDQVVVGTSRPEGLWAGVVVIAMVRAMLGFALWGCVRTNICEGQLPSVFLNECDRTDIEAAALLRDCWQLRFKQHLESALLIPESPSVAALLTERDVALRRLLAPFAPMPADPHSGSVAVQLTREGWEQVCGVCLGEARPVAERLDLLLHSARRAFELGSADVRVLWFTLSGSDSPSEIQAVTDRLLQISDIGVAFYLQRVFPSVAERLPSIALRLWHHFARVWDPVGDASPLLAFLAALIRANHTEDAYQIALGLRDRAEPLHAAMVAVKGQDVALLGRFAPEIAIPARDMLQVLWPEGLARPPAPRPSKKKRR
jgi:hypothetical protein